MVGLGGLEPPTSPLSVLRSLVPREEFTLTVQVFRYFDFRVTTRRRRVHRGDDTLDMQAQYWPSRITEHDERDCANRQVLLVRMFLSG